ncbi:MAG: hypothetical protein ACJAZ2_002002 [Glaciecola sp.]
MLKKERNINKQQILLRLILLIIGFIGVLSILRMDIPIPPKAAEVLNAHFTLNQIKLLLLINPTIMLIVAVVLGTVFYQKVNLKVPFIEKLTGVNSNKINTTNILLHGSLGGIIAGIKKIYK